MIASSPRNTQLLTIAAIIGCGAIALAGCSGNPNANDGDAQPSTETVTTTATATVTEAAAGLCTTEDLTINIVDEKEPTQSIEFTNTSSTACMIDAGYLDIAPVDEDGNAVGILFSKEKVSDPRPTYFRLAPGESVWSLVDYSQSPGTGAEITGATALRINMDPDEIVEFVIPLDGPMYYSNGDMKVTGGVGPLTAAQQHG